MTEPEERELKDLRMEVKNLKSEGKELREFIKAIYARLNEDEEYQSADDVRGGIEYGRINT